MKKSILVLAFLVWGSLWIYHTKVKKSMETTLPNTFTKESVQTTTSTPVPIVQSNISKKSPQNKSIENNSPMQEEKTETATPVTMHTIISMEEARSQTSPRKNITPVAAIEMQTEQLEKLKVNDTLKLPDIDGFDYSIKITSVQSNNDGSISITGAYRDEGINYTTTITQSEQETFINLPTPRGSYEIETSHGVGYIYATKDIRKQLQRRHTNDVIIRPIPKRTNH